MGVKCPNVQTNVWALVRSAWVVIVYLWISHKWILRVDLFTLNKYVTKTILLFSGNIVLIQMHPHIFTTCVYIKNCELLIQ